MTPGQVSKRVVSDRLRLIEEFIQEIRLLPTHDKNVFFSDRRNIWAAESCLRRSLEALFDIGRHILASGFGMGISEYKEIAVNLKENGVLPKEEAEIMRTLAGYRNRLVHFYHEVSTEELYDICSKQLFDVERVAATIKAWLRTNQDKVDERL